MAEEFGLPGGVRLDASNKGSIQIPYPKFDLGKVLGPPLICRNKPFRRIYATVDKNGEQDMRSIACVLGYRPNPRAWIDRT